MIQGIIDLSFSPTISILCSRPIRRIAPSFVPPMPPQGTLPTPPQPGMMNQQLPPVPQEKYDPNKADINKNGTVEDWEKARVSKFTK